MSDAPATNVADFSSEVAANAAPASTRSRDWSDAPIRNKLIALVIAVAVWGVAVGMLAATLNWGALAALAMAGVLCFVAVYIARRAIAEPVEDLVEQVRRMVRPGRPLAGMALPRKRRDEVGQLARAMYQIAATARRDYHDANQLRRTLDDRVAKATRAATAQLSQLAMRDPLTNLANRRFLDANADDLLNTCRQSGTDLVCIAVDMDQFKQVNDTLGHHVGDELIQFAAALIKASVREEDYAIRTGGDEFIILMPGCDIQRAAQITQHIGKHYLAHVRTTMPQLKGLGISFGLASLMRDGTRTARQLLTAADTQLYASKREQQN